jgi:hypothetical protein
LHVAAGQVVTLAGFPVGLFGQVQSARFLLTREPKGCPGCASCDRSSSVMADGWGRGSLKTGAIRLSGCGRFATVVADGLSG